MKVIYKSETAKRSQMKLKETGSLKAWKSGFIVRRVGVSLAQSQGAGKGG